MNTKVIAKNNINIIGNGEEVLFFIHGYGCSQTMWRFLTPYFEEKYKLVLIDLVGAGNSSDGAYTYQKYDSLNGYADDIIEICSELNLKNVTLIGHSISSNICTLAILQEPEFFKKLIMVCPSPRFINEGNYVGGFEQTDIDELMDAIESNYIGWSQAITPVIMNTPNQPELVDELELSFCSNNREIAKHFAKVTFQCDNREEFKKLDIDTLILQCRDDNLASVSVGEYVHQSIKSSRLKILETSGHCPHLSAPFMTYEAIKNFIDSK